MSMGSDELRAVLAARYPIGSTVTWRDRSGGRSGIVYRVPEWDVHSAEWTVGVDCGDAGPCGYRYMGVPLDRIAEGADR